MENGVGSNTLRLIGEAICPGAALLVSGRVGSGVAHTAAASLAGLALIGTGIAPVIGGLAILAVRVSSFTSAVKGRNLWDMGSEEISRRRHESMEASAAPEVSPTPRTSRGPSSPSSTPA
jgi:hypothetical protein